MFGIIKALGFLLLGLYVTYPIAFRLLSVVRRNAVFLPYGNNIFETPFFRNQPSSRVPNESSKALE